MKKIFAVIAFALVAACLITPKFIAPEFQEQVNTFIDKINKTPGYTANIKSTELSWFGSKNTISIGFDLGLYEPSFLNEKVELQFVLDTQYGPLLFASQGIVGLYETNIEVTGDEQRNLLTWDDNKPLYQLLAVGGFDGGVKFEDKVPAFTNFEKDLTFSGYSGEGEISSNVFSYEGLLAQANLDNPYQPVKAENIVLSIQIEAGLETIMKGGFYNSTTNLTIDTLTVGTNLSASGLTMLINATLDEETQLGTVQLGYLAKQLAYSDYQVSDLTLMTELTKLSNQIVLDYTDFNESLIEQNFASEDIIAEQLFFLQNNLEGLLSHQPEFNITDFSASFPEGRFNASLTSKLDDIYTPTLEEWLLPEFWLYNTLADASIEADDTLISNLAERFIANQMRTTIDSLDVKQQAQNIINNFEQQGFFFHEGDQYRSEIRFEGGEVDINGQPFPLM